MFTPSQFSQLAAAAWPATAFEATTRTVARPTIPARTVFVLTYEVAGYEYQGQGSTPFAALAEAIESAWAVGVVSHATYCAAQRTIEQGEGEFSGAAVAPAVTCAVCGEGRDPLGECACSYAPAARFAHV